MHHCNYQFRYLSCFQQNKWKLNWFSHRKEKIFFQSQETRVLSPKLYIPFVLRYLYPLFILDVTAAIYSIKKLTGACSIRTLIFLIRRQNVAEGVDESNSLQRRFHLLRRYNPANFYTSCTITAICVFITNWCTCLQALVLCKKANGSRWATTYTIETANRTWAIWTTPIVWRSRSSSWATLIPCWAERAIWASHLQL